MFKDIQKAAAKIIKNTNPYRKNELKHKLKFNFIKESLRDPQKPQNLQKELFNKFEHQLGVVDQKTASLLTINSIFIPIILLCMDKTEIVISEKGHILFFILFLFLIIGMGGHYIFGLRWHDYIDKKFSKKEFNKILKEMFKRTLRRTYLYRIILACSAINFLIILSSFIFLSGMQEHFTHILIILKNLFS